MPTLDFPTSIRPARVRWKLRTNTQIHRSPLSGVPTTYELPGARWEAVLEFRDWRRSELAALEVLLAKLRGPAGRVRVWNHAREVARGVATGTPAVVGDQNLLTYSEAFDNPAWSKVATNITPDAETAPDGSVSMDLVSEDTSDTNHIILASPPFTLAGVPWTISCDAKEYSDGAKRYLSLHFVPATAFTVAAGAIFDLATGTVVLSANGGVGSIEQVDGNPGLWRCSVTAVSNQDGNVAHRIRLRDAPSGVTTGYQGDGTSGLYIWGAQLQPYGLGDYIKTEGAPALPAAQTGTTLRTSGWTPNTLGIMKAGDMFTVNGELKMVTEDANSDAYSNAVLTFEPPLRNAPPDLTPINTTRPSAVMMLADDDQVDIDYVRSTGSLSLRFIEAIE